VDEWKHLEARTLKENVTSLLREAIIDGSLAAGEELNQAQVAERLGISRGPLREALGQLEQEGLIVSTPYKGVVVTALTPTYVRELYSLRGALETFAVRQGIERNDPKDVQALRRIIHDMRGAAEEDKELARLDLKFHSQLIHMARHDLLEKTWGPLKIGVRRSLRTRHQIYTSLDEVIGNHPALVDAIEQRDVERATTLLQTHIDEAGELIVEEWLAGSGESADA
jgi:DNA-binding GntR family transcriptional regulator